MDGPKRRAANCFGNQTTRIFGGISHSVMHTCQNERLSLNMNFLGCSNYYTAVHQTSRIYFCSKETHLKPLSFSLYMYTNGFHIKERPKLATRNKIRKYLSKPCLSSPFKETNGRSGLIGEPGFPVVKDNWGAMIWPISQISMPAHSVICQLSITEICAMFVLDMFQGMIMVTMRLMTEKMMEYNLSWFDVALYTVWCCKYC